MKTTDFNKTHSVKLLAIIVLLFLTQNIIQAQVFTRILSEEETIHDYIPWYFMERPDAEIAPPVDVAAVLAQDKKVGSTLDRFGVKTPMNLTEEDGAYYQLGDYYIWKIQIKSENAKSLNFEFENLNLPEESQMFIYGTDEQMIHRPVIAKNIHNGIYSSDIIYGDYVVIEVVLHKRDANKFSIIIKNAIHGIKEGEKAFGDSKPCNVNTACATGLGFGGLIREINAVCLILRDNVEHCTATLINNECSDLTPYLLTANHCVVGKNPQNWTFRFNYEVTTCTGITEPAANLWISFSGAQLRASWGSSDFALLELNSSIIGVAGINLAGWDRRNLIPASTVMIHHPRGDAKKITFDAAPPTINNSIPLADGLTGTTGNFLQTTITDGNFGDFGVTEGGSSGCALFNPLGRIIGQLYGGDDMPCNTTVTSNDAFGRLFSSWTGGGTNETRLSNWLGGAINPSFVNALSTPSISGDGVVCTTSKNYILNSPLQGYTVTWTVSPTNLFSSATAGNGTTATLWAANSNSRGAATLTYRMTNGNCNNVTITKDIWVGVNNFDFEVNTPLCVGDIVPITAFPTPLNSQMQPGLNITNVTFQGNSIQFLHQQSGTSILVEAVALGITTVCATATNECGDQTYCINVGVLDNGDCPKPPNPKNGKDDLNLSGMDKDIFIYPNPVEDIFTIEILSSLNCEKSSIQLMNTFSEVVLTRKNIERRTQIETIGLTAGLYFLQIQCGDTVIVKRVVIH